MTSRRLVVTARPRRVRSGDLKLGDEYMESFCSAGRRESSTWAPLIRPIELIGYRFRGSDWASTTWALRYRGMLRVCARAAASEACCVSAPARRRVTKCQPNNISGGNLLVWQCEPSPARLGAWVRWARSRSTLGVGCVCTQPTTAFKPKTLYNLIFPPTTPFYKMRLPSINFIHSSVFVTTTINDEAA